jgi:hypothetical protein
MCKALASAKQNFPDTGYIIVREFTSEQQNLTTLCVWRYKRTEYPFLAIFNRPQGQERSFLRFCQSLDSSDVHALVRSVTDECFEAVGSLHVPESDRSVIATTGKQTATGTEGDPPYPAGMALQGVQAITRLDIPQADRLVFASTGKQTSAWIESNGPDPTAMPS